MIVLIWIFEAVSLGYMTNLCYLRSRDTNNTSSDRMMLFIIYKCEWIIGDDIESSSPCQSVMIIHHSALMCVDSAVSVILSAAYLGIIGRSIGQTAKYIRRLS